MNWWRLFGLSGALAIGFAFWIGVGFLIAGAM